MNITTVTATVAVCAAALPVVVTVELTTVGALADEFTVPDMRVGALAPALWP